MSYKRLAVLVFAAVGAVYAAIVWLVATAPDTSDPDFYDDEYPFAVHSAS